MSEQLKILKTRILTAFAERANAEVELVTALFMLRGPSEAADRVLATIEGVRRHQATTELALDELNEVRLLDTPPRHR